MGINSLKAGNLSIVDINGQQILTQKLEKGYNQLQIQYEGQTILFFKFIDENGKVSVNKIMKL